ncbi:MAG: hypothetical protein AAB555_00235, partial [Patescibacteria group bacterium]
QGGSKKRKEENIELAKVRAQKLLNSQRREDVIILAMLYWAEGGKSERAGGLKFTNTDPALAKLYISLLRLAYQLDESRIRVRLHLHYYHRHREAVAFWSKLLDVPSSQFGKIYVKKRSVLKRFRKNFQGICFINYFDGAVRRELLSLGQQIAKKYAE